MDQLSTQLSEEVTLRQHFQTKSSEFETQIRLLIAENVKQNGRFDFLQTELRDQIHQLNTQSAKQEEEIHILNLKFAAFDTSENKNANFVSNKNGIKSDSLPRLPPSSCRQLSTIGHYLDGIYMVANPDTNKIEAVYCEFGSSTRTKHNFYLITVIFGNMIFNLKYLVSETLFGSVDVKSKSVHFFVQRSSDLSLANVVIPFDLERLNVGGAMNSATGIFTVPVDGIYHFEFSGLRDIADATSMNIYLNVNDVSTGICHVSNLPNYFVGLSGISASLKLKIGDQVTLFKSAGTLNDDWGHYTHFTGWLVEEDLVILG